MLPSLDAGSAWSFALDDLDEYLTTAEILVACDSSSAIPAWQPPSGLGALPQALAERARILLERNQELVRRLSDQSQALHHELEFLHSATAISRSHQTLVVDALL